MKPVDSTGHHGCTLHATKSGLSVKVHIDILLSAYSKLNPRMISSKGRALFKQGRMMKDECLREKNSCKISLNQLKNYNGLTPWLQGREDIES